MNKMLKPFVLTACAVAMICAADVPQAPFDLGFVREAEAGIFIRHARRATIVAASSANANAAAQQNQQAQQQNQKAQQEEKKATADANAAAANANAAAAAAKAPPPAPAGPPPPGTMVTTLPPGCTPDKLNNVDYMRCGSTYYKPAMMGDNLVFVVAQP